MEHIITSIIASSSQAAEVSKAYTGMTWKVIDGKRTWLPKEG